MKKRDGILRLFLIMLKIGLFTFGGGYAMIALLQDEFVSRRQWLEKEEFLDLTAIAESTPGPIAINAATYIGYQRQGFLGATVATVGIALPSFTIIFLISLFFDAFLSLSYVQYAFRGIQVCVIYLILSAGLKMLHSMKKNAFNLTVLISTVSVMILFSLLAVRFSTILYILISGTAGVVLSLLCKLGKEEKK